MYKLVEVFYSIQGEGYYAGTPAVFVRFSGCNLDCEWCDTDWEFTKMELSAEEVAEKIMETTGGKIPGMVVFTGGEPTEQLTPELVSVVRDRCFPGVAPLIAIETNGTNPLFGDIQSADDAVDHGVDWVCVAPKHRKLVIWESVHEIKVVMDGDIEPDIFIDDTGVFYVPANYYWIQPCERGVTLEKYREAAAPCIQFVKDNPEWNLSVQYHKLLEIR